MNRTRQTRVVAQPIERIAVPTVEFKEKCSGCGKFVKFQVLRTRGDVRYVRCPACGRNHALYFSQDTIRPLDQT